MMAIQSLTGFFNQEIPFLDALLDHRINCVSGLYYSKGNAKNPGQSFIDFGSDPTHRAISDSLGAKILSVTNKSAPIFSQIGWTPPPLLSDRLGLILGLRYNRDIRHGAGVKGDYSFRNTQFLPAFTANYRWSGDLTTYAKVATGYRAGYRGLEADYSGTVGPESLKSYEVGMKSYFLDRRVRFNAAAFVTKYKDRQVSIGVPSDVPAVHIFTTLNAGRQSVKGIELEALMEPIDDLTLALNYAHLHNHVDYLSAFGGGLYDKTGNPVSPYTAGDNIGDTYPVAPTPADSIGASVDYTVLHFSENTLTAHLDFRYQSYIAQTASAAPGHELIRLPSCGLPNGRLAWTFELPGNHHAKISAWSRNLTDKCYLTSNFPTGDNGSSVPTFVGDIPGYTTTVIQAWSEPRSYGIDLSYRFLLSC